MKHQTPSHLHLQFLGAAVTAVYHLCGSTKPIIPNGFHSVTLFFLGFKSTLLTGLPDRLFHSFKNK